MKTTTPNSRAGSVTDIRVAVDEDGSFRLHGHAQPRSEL